MERNQIFCSFATVVIADSFRYSPGRFRAFLPKVGSYHTYQAQKALRDTSGPVIGARVSPSPFSPAFLTIEFLLFHHSWFSTCPFTVNCSRYTAPIEIMNRPARLSILVGTGKGLISVISIQQQDKGYPSFDLLIPHHSLPRCITRLRDNKWLNVVQYQRVWLLEEGFRL